MRFLQALILIFAASAAVIAWTVVEYILSVRRNPEVGPYTFIYQERDDLHVRCAVTGTYRRLGETHIVVTEANGWPHVIDRRDILEVIA